MAWDGSADALPTARIAALGPSLQRSERRVVDVIARDPAAALERTAQELAGAVGVGRASVVRAAQSLGYEGYPQLRVALARELALGAVETAPADGTLLGAVRGSVERFGARLGHTVSVLTEEALESGLEALDSASRVLVLANGLSAPLGLDMMLRLTSAGRPAEHLADPLAQQIAARQLGAGAVCLVISGSGANKASLEGARAAREGGARIVAITSFARSPLAELADVVLVVPPVNETFRDELLHTSRAVLMLVTEALVDLLVARRGDRGVRARAAVLSVLGSSLQE